MLTPSALVAVADLVPGRWVSRAACNPMTGDLFFREEKHEPVPTEAKRLCRMCPVREQCGEHALVTGEVEGMWGGMTEGARKRIRTERRRA